MRQKPVGEPAASAAPNFATPRRRIVKRLCPVPHCRQRYERNNRILDIEDGKIRFQHKDYRRGGRQKPMTLNADEFIRRFLIHVLPDGFRRIRYYGLFGNRYRTDKLARCRELIGMSKMEPKADKANKDYRATYEELTGISLCQCPACHHGRMVLFRTLRPPTTSAPTIIDTS